VRHIHRASAPHLNRKQTFVSWAEADRACRRRRGKHRNAGRNALPAVSPQGIVITNREFKPRRRLESTDTGWTNEPVIPLPKEKKHTSVSATYPRSVSALPASGGNVPRLSTAACTPTCSSRRVSWGSCA
jgi:hypothetical protein